MNNSMRCVGCMTYGGPDVLQVLRLPTPQPGPRQMLVAVEMATVNPADLYLRSGELKPVITGAAPHVGGLELAGRVAALGEGSRWRVGQRVAAIASFIPQGRGAHCEYVVVGDDSAAAIPEGLSFAQAAVIPMSGLTAQLAVDRAGATRGTTVAITGAAGAVGAFATELASGQGARVIAVVGPEYETRVRRLGADEVVMRGPDAAAQVRRLAPGGVDAVIDAAVLGQPVLAMVRDAGRVVAVRAFKGAPERDIAIIPVTVGEYRVESGKLARLLQLASEGGLTPVVARTLPMAQAAQAHRLLAGGGLGGRAVLDFSAAANPQPGGSSGPT